MNKEYLKKASPIETLIYGLGDIGANFCWSFMAAYVTMYYTDSVGISAAAAGTMMLIARIFDGISDIIFAAVIDRCHMKLGKIRPWFIIAAPMLAIGLYASFHVPAGLSESSKIIYIYVTYIFVAAVAYTIYNLAYSAILPLMTLDENNRSFVSTFGRFFTLSGISLLNYVTPILLALWGGERSAGAWSKISTIYAIICMVLTGLMGIVITEKNQGEADADTSQEPATEQGSFMDNLKIVLGTKYTWLLIALFVVFFVINSIYAIRTYYYRDVLGDLSLFSVGSVLASIPSLIVLPFVPYLYKTFGRKRTIVVGMLIYSVITVVWTFTPENLTMAYVGTAIMAASWTPLLASVYLYVADIGDFLVNKYKRNVVHIVGMTSSIGVKLGTGFGSAIVGWGLALAKYDGTIEVQTQVTQNGIIILATVLPLVCAVLVLVIMFLWDMEKQVEKLQNN